MAWLLTAIISGRDVDRVLLKLSQWIFCFLIASLAFWAR